MDPRQGPNQRDRVVTTVREDKEKTGEDAGEAHVEAYVETK